ncbi:MAG: DUF87 domain-containing protein [Ignisphaera sp.]|uniref:DUF87 domain-containing protein n=1 Tax=Ignisphaera aggregans TaxID=334771 RepID=A0A7C4NNF1_9CREN
MYVGIDIVSGEPVFWNTQYSPSPHIMVVGPTGSGKTLTLLSLARRFTLKYNVNSVIFDIKDEYAQLLSLYGLNNIVILNPLEVPIPLCYCDSVASEKNNMVSTAVDALTKVFSLTSTSSKLMFRALMDICSRCVDIDNLTAYRFDVYDRELAGAVDTATRIFNVYPTTSAYIDLAPQKKVFVVNLRHIFLRDRVESAAVVLHILSSLMRYLSINSVPTPSISVILDEFWYILPYVGDDLINMLTRYSRGLGISMFIATQNIDDLHPYTEAVANNCGMLIAMSSPSISYWRRLQQYLNLSRKTLEYVTSIAQQGVAVARIAPNKIPAIVYIDPVDND